MECGGDNGGWVGGDGRGSGVEVSSAAGWNSRVTRNVFNPQSFIGSVGYSAYR